MLRLNKYKIFFVKNNQLAKNKMNYRRMNENMNVITKKGMAN